MCHNFKSQALQIIGIEYFLKIKSLKKIYIYIYIVHSYLYPDGRNLNPDLSWVVQATPEDHVKVG